jgi:hypothetical protein
MFTNETRLTAIFSVFINQLAVNELYSDRRDLIGFASAALSDR